MIFASCQWVWEQPCETKKKKNPVFYLCSYFKHNSGSELLLSTKLVSLDSSAAQARGKNLIPSAEEKPGAGARAHDPF